MMHSVSFSCYQHFIVSIFFVHALNNHYQTSILSNKVFQFIALKLYFMLESIKVPFVIYLALWNDDVLG